MERYVALLRGINVGGNKKVPMAELRTLLEKNKFQNIKTLLASGNVVFESTSDKTASFQSIIEDHFKFSIETLIYPFSIIENIVSQDPFKNITVTEKTRLYVTFYEKNLNTTLQIPYENDGGSFSILQSTNQTTYSVLNLENLASVDAMKIIEKAFGKKVTTRNYNTILKIHALN